MNTCPVCGSIRVVKQGFKKTASGNHQRFMCFPEKHTFTGHEKFHRASEEEKLTAVKLQQEGLGVRAIARVVGRFSRAVDLWLEKKCKPPPRVPVVCRRNETSVPAQSTGFHGAGRDLQLHQQEAVKWTVWTALDFSPKGEKLVWFHVSRSKGTEGLCAFLKDLPDAKVIYSDENPTYEGWLGPRSRAGKRQNKSDRIPQQSGSPNHLQTASKNKGVCKISEGVGGFVDRHVHRQNHVIILFMQPLLSRFDLVLYNDPMTPSPPSLLLPSPEISVLLALSSAKKYEMLFQALTHLSCLSLEDSRATTVDGRTLASVLTQNGERWYDRNSQPSLLVLFCEKNGDPHIPDARGRIPAVDAWGDIDQLPLSRVLQLRKLGVDFSTADPSLRWSVLSLHTPAFPTQEGVLDAIREGVKEDLERLPSREQEKRLSWMKDTVASVHTEWFSAMTNHLRMQRSLPLAPVHLRSRI